MRDTQAITIVYDGDCPFCAAFVRMARLRAATGTVRMVSARSGQAEDREVLRRIAAAGLDLDRGMVVEQDGVLYHGDAAMTLLALLTTPSGLFNRLVRLAFSRRWIARLTYPPLVAGRNATLWLLGRRRIGAGGPPTGRDRGETRSDR